MKFLYKIIYINLELKVSGSSITHLILLYWLLEQFESRWCIHDSTMVLLGFDYVLINTYLSFLGIVFLAPPLNHSISSLTLLHFQPPSYVPYSIF